MDILNSFLKVWNVLKFKDSGSQENQFLFTVRKKVELILNAIKDDNRPK